MKPIIKEVYKNSRFYSNAIIKLIFDSFSSYYYTRELTARDRNTPASVLSYLSEDEDYWVLVSVARNTNTPISVLKNLYKYQDACIRATVRQNPAYVKFKKTINHDFIYHKDSS